MQNDLNNVYKTIENYNKVINQRILEIHDFYVHSELDNTEKTEIIQKFYVKKAALERYFNMFLKHKKLEIYTKHANRYEKAKDNYIDFIVEFRKMYINLRKKDNLISKSTDLNSKTLSKLDNLLSKSDDLEVHVKTPENSKEAFETKTHINSVKTGINDNIKDLIIKPVPNCPGYSFGKYGDFDVIFRDNDGFINATKLCKLGGKRYKEWKETNTSNKLIKALKMKLYSEHTQKMNRGEFRPDLNIVSNTQNITSFDDIIVEDTILQENTSKTILGTYVHPKIINSIAMWISEDFALKVSDIVEEYFVKKANNNLNNLIKDYQNQLVLKEDSIQVLTKEIKVLNQTVNTQNNRMETLLNLAEKQGIKLDCMHNDIKTVINIGETIAKELPPTQNKKKSELLMIIKFDTVDEHNIYKYMAIKRQSRSVITTLNKIEKIRPGFKEIYCSNLYTNAQYIWNKLKEDLAKTEQISFKYSSFNLINCSEETLIYKINNLLQKQATNYNFNVNTSLIYFK